MSARIDYEQAKRRGSPRDICIAAYKAGFTVHCYKEDLEPRSSDEDFEDRIKRRVAAGGCPHCNPPWLTGELPAPEDGSSAYIPIVLGIHPKSRFWRCSECNEFFIEILHF